LGASRRMTRRYFRELGTASHQETGDWGHRRGSGTLGSSLLRELLWSLPELTDLPVQAAEVHDPGIGSGLGELTW
jgi:hypothetical protein